MWRMIGDAPCGPCAMFGVAIAGGVSSGSMLERGGSSMVEPGAQSEQRDQQDLFERVLDKVNASSIKGLLSRAKEEAPGDFGTSGSNSELVEHLKRAVGVSSVTRDQVFSLLQEAEEN